MNLHQIYALAAGQTLSKSQVLPEYFPLTSSKYITLQPFSKPIKNYNYWDDVVRLLKLTLPDYDVVQIGGPNEPALPFCLHTQGLTSIRQAAYLVKNAAVHLGTDSFAAHLAGIFNTPTVALYSNNHIDNVKPFFLDSDKFVAFRPFALKNPVFAIDIGKQPLDEIMPHHIVNAACELLKDSRRSNFDYLSIAPDYHKKVLELIPTTPFNSKAINFDCISVRMDVHFNEEVLRNQCQFSKVVVYTNRTIDLKVIKTIKPQIMNIIFEITDLANVDYEWFVSLQKLGVEFYIYSRLDPELIRPLKLQFCEIANLFHKSILDKPANVGPDDKYLSGKLVVADNKFYASIYDYKNNRESDPKQLLNPRPIGDGDFWVEQDHFAFIKEVVAQ
jgi:hypothetical protein